MAVPPSLTAFLVRRKRPLMLAPPVSLPKGLEIDYELTFADAAPADEAPARSGFGQDLRFFLTCYAVGLIFFLVMLN